MSLPEPDFDFDPRLKLETQTCFPLYAVSRLFTKAYQPLLAPLGLTYSQYLVMLLLWEHREIAVKDIGQQLLLDTGTLTPLLKLLEQRGLVSRHRDPRDERSVLIRLLPAGAALYEPARQVPAQLAQLLQSRDDSLVDLRPALNHLITLLR
jgi:DNA-binding MarR family transcriptional regulator